MANYGFDDLTIEVDGSEGGGLVDISQHVTAINGVNIEAVMEESHAAGDAWVEQLFAGLRRIDDITIEGFYDDGVSPAPDTLFVAGVGETRSLRITYGGTKTTDVETLIRSYNRTLGRGESHKYELVLAPTGAPTEA